MSTFAQAVAAQTTTTTNGAAAYASTLSATVDLFFKIGASRGKNVIPDFTAAYVENPDVALRIVQWARDIRGGSGERQIFRDVLLHLENTSPADAQRLMTNVPEIGRWDDLLVFTNPLLKDSAFRMIKTALEAGNGLCAKWMPRKGKVAEELRAFLGYSPKRYRKTLVSLTQVVETQMCAKAWDTIEFGKIPSLASSRYKKAFVRNAPESFAAYTEALSKGEAKVNAGAVFPYDVLKGVSRLSQQQRYSNSMTLAERQHIVAQWAALENFVGDASVLPMVDVSGSMECPAGGNPNVTCMDVAVSLGLYLADKNTGKFKDTFLTFTDQPKLYNLQGDVLQKLAQMTGQVGYSTNLEAAFREVLRIAKEGKVSQEEMPGTILILSDMQFDQVSRSSATAFDMIRDEYKAAGYTAPRIVFWNINAHGNVPTRFNQAGVALVSGFSPAIAKTVLKAENFDPMNIMLDAVMVDRYKLA